jgi:hypothetical protein
LRARTGKHRKKEWYFEDVESITRAGFAHLDPGDRRNAKARMDKDAQAAPCRKLGALLQKFLGSDPDRFIRARSPS